MRGYALTGDRAQLTPYERARAEIAPAGRKLLALEPDARAARAGAGADPPSSSVRRALDGVIARPDATRRRRRARPSWPAGVPRRPRRRSPPTSAPSRCSCAPRAGACATARSGSPPAASCVLLVLIALLAFGAVRAIVGPVSRLQRFARELGAGRFGTRLPETGPPETAELAQAFNLSAETPAARRPSATWPSSTPSSATRRSGIAFLDLDLRFLRVNEALARMNQVPAAEHLGRTVGEVTGQHDVERALREVVETRRAAARPRHRAPRPPLRGELLRGPRRPRRAARGRQGDDRRHRPPARRDRARAPAGRHVGAGQRGHGRRRRARSRSSRPGWRWTPARPSLLLLDAERERAARSSPTAASTGDARRAGGRSRCRSRCRRPTPARTRPGASSSPTRPTLLERYPGLEGTPYPRAGAYASLPLVAYGRDARRALVRLRRARSRSTPTSAALLTALAAQTAIALARAQLYEREHTVSQTLQASLLPRALPADPGLDLAGRLEAGRQGRRGRRRLLRRVRDRRRRLGHRDRRRLRQGRRRRRADRARPPHRARGRARARLARGGARGAQPRRAGREPRRASS